MSALIMMNMFMLQEHLEIQCNSYFFFTYTVSSFQVDIGVVCSVEILRNQCNRDSSMVRQAIWYLQQTHVLGKVHGGLITASPCFSPKVLPADLSHSKLDRINHMALLSSKAIEVFIVFLMTRKKKEEPTIYYITLKPAANLVLQHQVPVFSSQSPLWVVQHFILIWGILGIYYFIVSLTGGSAGSKERKSDFAFLLYKVEFFIVIVYSQMSFHKLSPQLPARTGTLPTPGSGIRAVLFLFLFFFQLGQRTRSCTDSF